jgi:CheY-like chemotaxis protein
MVFLAVLSVTSRPAWSDGGLHMTSVLNGRSAMILVVDDDPEVREIVSEFLLDSGHTVVQAEGGPQALRLLNGGVHPDLVITDVRMPEMSGIELADRIARDQPDMKVILISGFFVSQRVDRRVLKKPFRMKELADAVESELAH